jgi:hypothetical protein
MDGSGAGPRSRLMLRGTGQDGTMQRFETPRRARFRGTRQHQVGGTRPGSHSDRHGSFALGGARALRYKTNAIGKAMSQKAEQPATQAIPIRRTGQLPHLFFSLAATYLLALCPLGGFAIGEARAQDTHVRAHPPGSDADLAQQLQNPVASLISLPFQNNFDFGGGPRDNGFGYTVNFQPVIPFRLTDDWNLITRTIVPFIHQERYTAGHETGFGDTTQSFFFSPRSDVPGLTWGVGPAVLWPTATRPAFQSRQWGAGPTAVAVQQSGPWTFGLLANHLWGFADSANRQGRPDLSQSFIQPFLSHNFSNGFAVTSTLEASYDWSGREWTLPLGAGVSQLVNLGSTPVNLVAQARYWLDGPQSAPEWGLRFAAVVVLR